MFNKRKYDLVKGVGLLGEGKRIVLWQGGIPVGYMPWTPLNVIETHELLYLSLLQRTKDGSEHYELWGRRELAQSSKS